MVGYMATKELIRYRRYPSYFKQKQTDMDIQIYHGSTNMTAAIKAHRKPWRGEFLALQIEHRSKV